MKKFSLNDLLHKDRVMIIFSLVLAIVVWAIISFGPGNVQQRTITATVKLDLTDTSAEYDNLRVIGEDTFTINITVEGTRSVIYSLTPADLEIKPDLSDIQGPGRSYVSVSVSKAGRYTDYTINSISPATITVECEKWTNDTYPVVFTDEDKALLNVSVSDEKTQYLPKKSITLDPAVVKNGRVQIEGPQAITSQIDELRVVLDGEHTLSKTTQLKARLVAYNEADQPVDLTGCTIVGSSDQSILLTVPVRSTKEVKLTYTVVNRPAGISEDGLVQLFLSTTGQNTPITSMILVGESDALASVGDEIDLGEIDFDRLLPSGNRFSRQFSLPEGVEALGGNEVIVDVAIGNYRTQKRTCTVDTIDRLTIVGLPKGKVVSLFGDQRQLIKNIELCGKSYGALTGIREDQFVLTVDLTDATSGYTEADVRITVKDNPDVWVYYGEEDSDGYRLQLQVEDAPTTVDVTE